MKRLENEYTGVGILAIAFIIFVVTDTLAILVTSIAENQYLGIFTYGYVMGQLGVLAVWATIGPNKFWIRWPLSFAMLIIGFNTLIFAIYISVEPIGFTDLNEFLRFNFMMPLMFLAAQAPIWLARILIGWRVRRPQDAASEKERKFGILEILIVMTYFGGSLALGKFAMDAPDPTQGVVMTIAMSLYSSMWVLMFAIPALLGVLLPNHTRGTVAVLILYFASIFLVPTTAIWLLAGGFSMEAVGGIGLFVFGCALSYVSYLLVLKAYGYVLEVRVGKMSNVVESPFADTGSPFADTSAWEALQMQGLYQNMDASEADGERASNLASDAASVESASEMKLANPFKPSDSTVSASGEESDDGET